MWGGKFNLGKFKIFGAWYPRRIEDIKIQLSYDNAEDFLDYKDLQIADFNLTSADYKEENYIFPQIPPEENRSYFLMKDFMPREEGQVMPECAELIIDNFEDIKIYSDNEHQTYYYNWKNATLQLVSYENNQNINIIENADIIIQKDKLNRYIIKINSDINDGNSFDVYKKYKFRTYDANNYEKIKTLYRSIGTFYIVQDRNYNNFNLSDTIYPIDYGIKNATVFDRIEKCVAKRDFAINFDQNLYSYNCSQLQQYKNKNLSYFINPMTMKPFECNCQEFTKSDGTKVYGDLVLIRKNQIYYKWTRDIAKSHQSLGQQIIIDTKHYPGCFRLVGETRARRRQDGIDERFQFEIPLCKLNSSNSFSFSAEGEPTVYNMSFKALQNSEGILMKLTQYEVEEKCEDNYSHIVPYNTYIPEVQECCNKPNGSEPQPEPGVYLFDPQVNNCFRDWLPHRGCNYVPSDELLEIEIINPPEDTVFTIEKDFGNPYNGEAPYLKLPISQEKAEEVYNAVQSQNYYDEYRDILLVLAHYKTGDRYLVEGDDIEYNFVPGDAQ